MGLPVSVHLHSAYDFVLRTDGADLDVRAADPSGKGRMSRAVVAVGSGTLIVTRYDDNPVTLPAAPNGFMWEVQTKFIAAASTATGVVVLY